MPEQTTCWTLVRDAAEGDVEARRAFAERYRPVVRAYLEARRRGRLDRDDLEDALQEVFLECFRSGGVLEKSAQGIATGFRAFLFSTVRKVALRIEQRCYRQLDRVAVG